MFSALNFPVWKKKISILFYAILCLIFFKYTRKTNIVCNKKVQCKLIDYMIPKCILTLIINENNFGSCQSRLKFSVVICCFLKEHFVNIFSSMFFIKIFFLIYFCKPLLANNLTTVISQLETLADFKTVSLNIADGGPIGKKYP